ncbi:MAG: hypothetical protein ACR2O6_12995 [Ilumatobacteraceae bacterium]
MTNTHSPTIRVNLSNGRTGVTRRLTVLCTSAVLIASGFSATGVSAAPDETGPDQCVSAAVGTADSAERWQQRCRELIEHAYTSCMRDAAGTPDSLERWVDTCRARAKRTAV